MKAHKNSERVGKTKMVRPEKQQGKGEQLVVPETPIKKQTLSSINFSFDLSPLPLPPKIDHLVVEPFNGYSRELMIVETPVIKEPSKLPIHEE